MSALLARQTIRIGTTSDGVKIAYATAGKGPPLVMVGNWLSHLQLNWESEVWRHWNNAFLSRHTLIRFDPRGCGLSERDPEEISLAAWVRDLETVVNALQLERFAILGLCQGAAVAIAYAAAHPERVSRLICYGGYLRGAYVSNDSAAALMARTQEQMIRLGWGRANTAYQELFVHLLMPEANPEQVRTLCELQRRSAAPDCAARLFAAFHALDIHDIALRVEAPALVLHLRGDGMVPFSNGPRLAAQLSNARFVPLEGNNHLMLADEPAWPAFLAEASQFLAEGMETGDPAFSELTAREHAVLDCLARGLSNTEIAETLHITPKTVRNHVSSIFSKLNIKHRNQAIVRAREAGFGQA